MTTRVVHYSDHIPGAVYIGRAMPRMGLKASFWANPFTIGTLVTSYEFEGALVEVRASRNDVINAYKLRSRDWPEFWERLPELRGKPLACWCRHDGQARTDQTKCHGDWLVWLLDRFTDDELRKALAALDRPEDGESK